MVDWSFSFSPLSDGLAGRAPAGPTVLALDTTAGICSVALLHQGALVQTVDPAPGPHSHRILGRIRQLLAEAQLSGTDLDALALGAGPGSFTGLRLACGVAQGLALGWGLPVVAVSSMASLAMQALAQAASPAREDRILVALDARMNECYLSVWSSREGEVTPVGAVSTCPVPELSRHLSACRAGSPQARLLLAGDGFALLDRLDGGTQGAESGPLAGVSTSATHPMAWAVARIAAQRLRQGLAQDPAEVAPFYVRDKVALDVTEQAALRRERAHVRDLEDARDRAEGPASQAGRMGSR